jgi:mono/diheme cytochrome c family protein
MSAPAASDPVAASRRARTATKRGAPRALRATRARLGAALRRYGFAAVALGLIAGGAAVGVYQGLDQRAVDTASVPSAPERPFRSERELLAGKPTRELFGHACGSCHTLRAANVTGAVGPSLDERRLKAGYVEQMILNGSVSGAMPARMLEGDEARRVARYVARVARRGAG